MAGSKAELDTELYCYSKMRTAFNYIPYSLFVKPLPGKDCGTNCDAIAGTTEPEAFAPVLFRFAGKTILRREKSTSRVPASRTSILS